MYELFKGEEADAPEDTLVLLEWWADAAALEAHLKSPHIQQEREQNYHFRSPLGFNIYYGAKDNTQNFLQTSPLTLTP